MTARLADRDRDIITRARALSDAFTTDSMRPLVGQPAGAEGELVRAEALGVAQYLLAELADLAERVTGGEDQGGEVSEDTGRLDRIRVVLAKFDWEHDDRQLALEAIERIADGGQA